MATANASPIATAFREIVKPWAPPPRLTVSQWADSNRRLSSESSAKAGRWQTRPYQREPMDEFTNSRVHTIVLMVARQTLKTEVINNCLGYAIDQDPGPTLVVQFRDTDCKRFSKIRLAPMLRDTPCLRNKVADVKSRESSNTFEYKAFPGGHLSLVASGSPGNLAALPIRYLFCDEIDKYPVSAGSSGDPISLAQGRQEEFWNRKTVLACTPTIARSSRIAAAYLESDQREYEPRCPTCGEFQVLRWAQVRWNTALPREQQAESARYHCQGCGAAWADADRYRAVWDGRYRATAPFNGIAGFRVSGLCRIGTRLAALVEEFISRKDQPEALKTFVNEQLAELWEEKGEAPQDELLYERARRERYERGTVPVGGLFLTAGVDVQKRYLQYEIVAWGRGKESWSIDYGTIEGNPQQPEVWAKLAALLNQGFPHEAGFSMPIAKMAVDSGHATNDVYAWVRRQGDRAIAVDGRPGGSVPVAFPSSVDVTVDGRKITNGLKLWPVSTGLLKSELYGWLMLSMPSEEELNADVPYPPGFCHFPQYDVEFFKQLTAEHLVTRLVRGYPKPEWQKTRERNEALDCRVYARAAAYVHGLDKANDEHWSGLERRIAEDARAAKQKAAGETVPVRTGPQRQVVRSSFMG